MPIYTQKELGIVPIKKESEIKEIVQGIETWRKFRLRTGHSNVSNSELLSLLNEGRVKRAFLRLDTYVIEPMGADGQVWYEGRRWKHEQ